MWENAHLVCGSIIPPVGARCPPPPTGPPPRRAERAHARTGPVGADARADHVSGVSTASVPAPPDAVAPFPQPRARSLQKPEGRTSASGNERGRGGERPHLADRRFVLCSDDDTLDDRQRPALLELKPGLRGRQWAISACARKDVPRPRRSRIPACARPLPRL